MLFVWTNGLRGANPEKWPESLKGANEKEFPTLARHQLPCGEEKLSLDALALLYPVPVAKDDEVS